MNLESQTTWEKLKASLYKGEGFPTATLGAGCSCRRVKVCQAAKAQREGRPSENPANM